MRTSELERTLTWSWERLAVAAGAVIGILKFLESLERRRTTRKANRARGPLGERLDSAWEAYRKCAKPEADKELSKTKLTRAQTLHDKVLALSGPGESDGIQLCDMLEEAETLVKNALAELDAPSDKTQA